MPAPPAPWGNAGAPLATFQDRDRTRTGVLLLAIGVGIAWIPYVGGIGGLLALIGVILVFVGRRGFDEPHRRSVVIGGVLLVVGFLSTIVLAGFIVGAVLSAGTAPGANPQAVFNATAAVLNQIALGGLIVGVIGGVGQLLMVYQLGDPLARQLLILGLIASLVIASLIYLVELPQISRALTNPGPNFAADQATLNQLQAQLQLDSVARIIPSLIFAVAYYRIWQRVDSLTHPPI